MKTVCKVWARTLFFNAWQEYAYLQLHLLHTLAEIMLGCSQIYAEGTKSRLWACW